jgi:cytochrome c
MGRARRRWTFAGFVVVVALVLVACPSTPDRVPAVPDGDPERGRAAITAFGCAACHAVPGVREADALVGPPLDHFARRGIIAGRHPNRPEVLIEWIMRPQRMNPGSGMPDMGVPEQVARDIAAYLYTLD